ncbi:hypothetical protein SDC9_107253 [bioreactor metagenome]|uniref:Uncharacterized protein n=1 Tax=bioreactor metagenome TaxID=1076179 RepID=A0A645B4N7_9ZZZZ
MLIQVHHPVGKHLRVNTKVLFISHILQHRVRQGADAKLQGGAVLNQRRHIAANSVRHLVNDAAAQLRQGSGHLHAIAQLGHVEEGIPHGPGHMVVDLGQNQLGVQGGGLGAAHAHAQRHVAVLIRGRHGNHRNVDGKGPVGEKTGRLMEEKGRVIRPPLLNGPAGGGAHEHGVVADMALHLGVAVLPFSHGDPVYNLHIPILLIVPYQRVHQGGGLVGRVAEENPGPVGNVLHGLLRRGQLGSVYRLPVFHLQIPPLMIQLFWQQCRRTSRGRAACKCLLFIKQKPCQYFSKVRGADILHIWDPRFMRVSHKVSPMTKNKAA